MTFALNRIDHQVFGWPTIRSSSPHRRELVSFDLRMVV